MDTEQSGIDLTGLLADLVGIDSVNPDLVPGGAGEHEIAQYVMAWAERCDLEVHRVEAAPGRPSVVVVARGSGGGRSLMLCGHLDTVGVQGMTEPFMPRIEGGRLYGRGAYDMKGGLAACLWTAAQARALGLRGDVLVACVADEEAASLGVQAVLRNWQADAAIVTEPTGLDVCVAHKGFVWLEASVQGRAAHGSRPDLGVDAIAKAGRLLTGLDDLAARLAAGPHDPLLGTGSVHASLIQGGQELSSYPEFCTVGIERRTVPGESAQGVLGEVQAIITQGSQADPEFQAGARVTLVRDPFKVPPNAEIVALVRAHAARLTGLERRVYGEGFWMDSAFLSSAGIPTVVFGPAGAGAHAIEEWVDLASVQQCADVLLAVVREFCA